MGDGLGLGPLGGAVEKHQKHQKATAPGRASTMRCSFIFPSCTDWTGCVGLDLITGSRAAEGRRGAPRPVSRCPGCDSRDDRSFRSFMRRVRSLVFCFLGAPAMWPCATRCCDLRRHLGVDGGQVDHVDPQISILEVMVWHRTTWRTGWSGNIRQTREGDGRGERRGCCI